MFTTLTKEALPLLRYRTGDLATVTREPCACGRTTARMSRIRGRVDDMLVVRGVNLFPSEVERVLLAVPELAPHYQLVLERPGRLDELTIEVEARHVRTCRGASGRRGGGLRARAQPDVPGARAAAGLDRAERGQGASRD